MKNIAVVNLKSILKKIDSELYKLIDEDYSQIHSYFNLQGREYFEDFDIGSLLEALDIILGEGLEESSIYFQKIDKISKFIVKARDEYRAYDNNKEIQLIKDEISKDKLRFFKKAIMFDGKQRDIVMDKIDEKNKELTFDYEYIADNILTSLWKAGFEEKIEDKFLEAKIDDLPYFHFSNYNKMPIENKVSHIYY